VQQPVVWQRTRLLGTLDASTSDSDGNVGLPGDRVDVYADGIDSTTLSTDDLYNDDRLPSVVLKSSGSNYVAIGPNGKLGERSSAADVLINDVFPNVSSFSDVGATILVKEMIPLDKQVMVPGSGYWDASYRPLVYQGIGHGSGFKLADSAALNSGEPMLSWEQTDNNGSHGHGLVNLKLDGNKGNNLNGDLVSIATSGSVDPRFFQMRSVISLDAPERHADLRRVRYGDMSDCMFAYNNDTSAAVQAFMNISNVRIEGMDGIGFEGGGRIGPMWIDGCGERGADLGVSFLTYHGNLQTAAAPIYLHNNSQNASQQNLILRSDTAAMGVIDDFDSSNTGLSVPETGAYWWGPIRNVSTEIAGSVGENQVNGYGGENAGSGNPPSSSVWNTGNIVKNLDDGTYWINAGGSFDQIG